MATAPGRRHNKGRWWHSRHGEGRLHALLRGRIVQADRSVKAAFGAKWYKAIVCSRGELVMRISVGVAADGAKQNPQQAPDVICKQVWRSQHRAGLSSRGDPAFVEPSLRQPLRKGIPDKPQKFAPERLLCLGTQLGNRSNRSNVYRGGI